MGTYEVLWGPLGTYGTYEGFDGLWGPMGAYGDSLASMGTFGDPLAPMGTFGDPLAPMGTYGGLGRWKIGLCPGRGHGCRLKEGGGLGNGHL